ncbi:MAG: hypothetical protein OXT09_31905 [Myxococcales bacterium]|nr:hypothetical protein [Myxococcales bacterium]
MRRRVRPALIAAAALTLPPTAVSADRVHLVGGSVREGEATVDGDRVVLDIPGGQLTLSAAEVERIEESETPIERFAVRRAKLDGRDVKGRLALADFARDHGLRERERELLREVLALEPDHEQARLRLGYVRTDAGWQTHDEHNRARGLVLYGGQWITPEQQLELERLRAETARARSAARKAELEVEAERIDLERARRSGDDDEAEADGGAQPATQVSRVVTYGGPFVAPHGHVDHRDCRERRCRTRARRPKVKRLIPHVRDPSEYF